MIWVVVVIMVLKVEGFGLLIVEVLVLGVLVIVCDILIFCEIVGFVGCYFLFDDMMVIVEVIWFFILYLDVYCYVV